MLENASLRNYDIIEICLSMTSHQYPKILFHSLSFDIWVIRGRFVVMKIQKIKIGVIFFNHHVLSDALIPFSELILVRGQEIVYTG